MSSRLFDAPITTRTAPPGWSSTPLPLIASKGITDEVYLNFESTGLKWFDGDKAIGVSVGYPTDAGPVFQYFAWGHASGNNTSADVARGWLNREFKGVRWTNTNTRFDIHTGREFGVDFEALGCHVSDISHMVALLDEHRHRTSLDSLIPEFIGKIRVQRLDESRLYTYPGWMAAPRAAYNVEAVHELRQLFIPRIEEEELARVLDLEENLIYVVCEMEKNGSPIDLDLLHAWDKRSKQEVEDLQRKISRALGRPIQVDLFGQETGFLNPDSWKEMVVVFERLHLPITKTASGRPSFTASVLEAIDHPVIADIRKLNKLLDLRAKFIVGDLKRVCSDGILRYALHQLRAVKDPTANSREAGAATGRFSSTEITAGVGVNIQQRIKVAKQRVVAGYDEDDTSHDDELYLIRRLHRPANPGWKWLSGDARQIEYRLFANEVDSPRINAAYENDPLTSFHKFMHAQLKQWLPQLTYRRMKDVNFAKVYAAGPKKIALMLGFITQAQFEELTETKAHFTHPLLKETMEILKIYDREIPEARPLQKEAEKLAKNRGYIKSILGRRQRFPNGYRLHKALNSRIQPSGADIMKMKLVELHRQRKYTNLILRFTVHDEVDGDIPDAEHARRVADILDQQDFNFKIPILWDVGIGSTWADADEPIESTFIRQAKERARERQIGTSS